MAGFQVITEVENEAIAELRKLFESQTGVRDIVLDLKDVGVIDRDAMHFFVICELDGVKLENCASYMGNDNSRHTCAC